MPVSVIDLAQAYQRLTFFGERTPESDDDRLGAAFASVAPYRDGDLFIGHYAGDSAWERHPSGDEIVMVMEGSADLILLEGEDEVRHRLAAGQLVVVPRNVWHRFEVSDGVKVFTATPAPEEHSVTKPVPD